MKYILLSIILIISISCKTADQQDGSAQDTLPPIIDAENYLNLAQEKNFIRIPYHSYVLHYLDKDIAFRLADLEMKYIIAHGDDDYLFIYLKDFSILSDTNPEIGKIFFKYYNHLMGKLKSQQFPNHELINRLADEGLFCALIKHRPDGFKDSLLSNQQYLKKEIIKIHPDSYSFFGKIWHYISTVFSPYWDYKFAMDLLIINSKALKALGDTTEYNEMLKLLDTDVIKIYRDSLYCHSMKEEYSKEKIIDLDKPYSSIRELFSTDSIMISTMQLLSWPWMKNLEITRPVIVKDNKAIFWICNCNPDPNQNDFNLIRITLINETKLKRDLIYP